MSPSVGLRAEQGNPAAFADGGRGGPHSGAQRLRVGQVDTPETRVRPRWPMEELPPLSGAEPGVEA